MPNYCYTTIRITGTSSELSRLRKGARGTNPHTDDVCSLKQLVPLDERAEVVVENTNDKGEKVAYSRFAEMERDGFDGYAEALDKWGSKWGDCETYLHRTKPTRIDGYFTSAWSPCTQLLINLSKEFPTLLFAQSFTEESDAYAGWELIYNGEMVASGDVSTETPPEIDRLFEDGSEEASEEAYEQLYGWRDVVRDRTQEFMELDADVFTKVLRREVRRAKRRGDEYPDYYSVMREFHEERMDSHGWRSRQDRVSFR